VQLRYFSGWCTKIYGKSADLKSPGGITGQAADLLGYTIKEPAGVAGCIIPWNGPTINAIIKLAPALTAGCSVVLKPAEETRSRRGYSPRPSPRRACPKEWSTS
jgi:phenylacetaldehyde dehydrogenase